MPEFRVFPILAGGFFLLGDRAVEETDGQVSVALCSSQDAAFYQMSVGIASCALEVATSRGARPVRVLLEQTLELAARMVRSTDVLEPWPPSPSDETWAITPHFSRFSRPANRSF